LKADFKLLLQILPCYNKTIEIITAYADYKERPVSRMLLVRLYRVEDKEVMIMDGNQGYMPGENAIRLLASRKFGVGADRVIIHSEMNGQCSFTVYDAEGYACALTAADRALLGRQADCEVRLTDYFAGKMRQADECELAAAC